jgi:hypothetical protein
MNTNYLAIVLWIGSMIVQFVAYMVLAARQRGRDEIKIAEIAVQKETIKQLRDDAEDHRLMTESIMTYLETKNGIQFRRR